MTIRELKDKETWQTFVISHAPASGAFLHAWEYGEMGARRMGVYRGDDLVSVAMVSLVELPFGLSYGLIQKGPIMKDGVLLSEVLDLLGGELKVMFVRFEPVVNAQFNIPNSQLHKTIHVSPEETLMLDLTKTEEELQADMHQKTRYNIRLAEKKGVEVRELEKSEWEQAWKIFEETAKRDGFRLHAKDRYVNWLERFPGARLVGAFFEHQLLAVNVQIDAYGTRTYLHGASSNVRRDVMAPYALHWREIRDAKKEGITAYDFWGVSDTNPAWKGITRFKLGFGGKRLRDGGTFDFVLNKKRYVLYQLLRFLRRGGI